MTASKVRIYHNPRCTKSRETLSLLRERGIEPEIVEYLKERPSARDVKQLVKKLGIAAHSIVRTKEAAYARLGLSPNSTLEQIAQAIEEEPILLERPIVVAGDKAAIGRPPERVLDIV